MSDKPEAEPRLVSYGLNLETCTLNHEGQEYYFNREHPAPPSELVKAAEEVARYMRNPTGVHRVEEYMPLIENLRAALDKVKS